MLRDFTDSAKALTRNPLGIIGLFLTLVYGFACLAISFGSQLTADERKPLIWFLTLFPMLVLLAFFRLVTHHHRKLYSPSDFRDERLFVTPLSDVEYTRRLDDEIRRVEAESASDAPAAVPVELNTEPHGEPKNQTAAESPAQTPEPPNESTDAQTNSLAKTRRPRVSTERSTYADAERLAFIALEREIGKPFQKYVEIKAHGRNEQFDGALILPKEAHLIEVKFFLRPYFKREFIEALLHRASSFLFEHTFDENLDRDTVIFWLVLVVGFDRSELPDFEERVRKAVGSPLFECRLRFYHIEDLRNTYG